MISSDSGHVCPIISCGFGLAMNPNSIFFLINLVAHTGWEDFKRWQKERELGQFIKLLTIAYTHITA